MFPYIVWAPPFDRRSGGCKVLHALAHELDKKGVLVYLNTTAQNPPWRVKSITTSEDLSNLVAQGAIAIYPEIIFDNPHKCNIVVRWVLNIPGKISGPKEYPSTDLVYFFNKSFDIFGTSTEEDILHYPPIELDIFFDKGLKRSGKCFYVGKGTKTPRIPETHGLVEITRSYPLEQADFAGLLQKSELMYTYDNETSVFDNARLCGCPVVQIPGYCKREDMHPVLGWDGMGWGVEETQKAIDTMDSNKLRQLYLGLKDDFNIKLDGFIEKTQKIASERNK